MTILERIKSHNYKSKETVIILTAVLVFVFALGGFYLLSTRGNTVVDDKNISITPSPSRELTPTKKPTKTPTPKLTLTVIPTASPTQSPTATSAPTATPAPTSTPTPVPDNQAPKTNIVYPQNGGEITYKTDGKVCVTAGAPTDNQSSWGDIQTEFAFDTDSWSGYAANRSYLCKDSLPNGAHTLKVRSKDKAGNVEADQTLSFTVNIPGN